MSSAKDILEIPDESSRASAAPWPAESRAWKPPSARRALIWGAKAALLAVVLYFVGTALYGELLKVPWATLEVNAAYLALSMGCLIVVGLISVIIRRLLLESFRWPLGWGAVTISTWVPMLGKYLPGKVAGVIGAVWMLRRYSVPGSVAVGMVLMVNGLAVWLGLMLAVPLTLWTPVREAVELAWLWCAIIILCGTIALHPRIFCGVGNWMLRRLGKPELPALPRMRDYAIPVVLLLVNWGIVGLALWFMARSIEAIPLASLPLFISAAALGASAGMLAIFAPVGVGVREGILLAILLPIMHDGSAAIVVIAMRLTHILVDILLAGVGLLMLTLFPKAQ